MRTRNRQFFITLTLLSALLLFGLSGSEDAWAQSERLGYTNKIGGFGGVVQESSDFAAVIGVNYQWMFHEDFGLGGLLEFSGGGVGRTWLIGVPLYFHTRSPLYFLVAPGIEFEDSDSDLFFRVGVGYEFAFNPRWSLVPAFNVDFVENDDTKFVYGLGVFYAF